MPAAPLVLRGDEVCELVLNVSEKQSPQPRISQRRLTDTEATEILQRICGEEPVLNMPKERQKNVVENAYAAGIGLRQLSRITKISYGAIVVMRRKSNSIANNKPKEPSLWCVSSANCGGLVWNVGI